MTDPQLCAYAAGRYPSTARAVGLAIVHYGKPCIGIECDEGAPCRRHERTAEVVVRVVRMRERRDVSN